MLYNDTTWNKLNRFFNIFNPKVYKSLLLVNGVLLVWGIVFGLVKDKVSVGEFVFCVAVVNLVLAPNLLLHCPKTLFLHKGTAEFADYVSMKPRRVMTTNFWWLKVSYTVTEIKEIQFHQNAFERLFDVGRISFSGETEYTAKRDEDRIVVEYPFVICGIRNFSEFQEKHSAYKK